MMSVSAEHNKPTYGFSLPVPNVQEMVKKNPLQVPERYIRSSEEMEEEKYMTHLSSQIPVIDLELLLCDNSEELFKLDLACKEWGFFKLVNHGAKKEVIQKMNDRVAEFLNLPIEEKKKYAMTPEDVQGYGQVNVVAEDQPLDWGDALVLLQYPTQFRKLQYWPKTPLEFQDAVEVYASEINRVGREILGSLSLIMGLEKHVLLELHKDLHQGFLVNNYPPCNTPEQVHGMSPHSDNDTITLLMQNGDINGLEIRHKGNWVPVPLVSDGLVVFIGDMIEIWSNGKYKSVEHRARPNRNKGRTSYVSFFFPKDDVEVEPFEKMIDAQNSKLYKKVNYGEYLRGSLKRKMDGKTFIVDSAKIDD